MFAWNAAALVIICVGALLFLPCGMEFGAQVGAIRRHGMVLELGSFPLKELDNCCCSDYSR